MEGAFYESELQLVADRDSFPVEKVRKVEKFVNLKFMGYKEPRWQCQWMPADALVDI